MGFRSVQALLPFVGASDRSGRSSGKLPPIAVAAVAESTAGLDTGPINSAIALANELEQARRVARMAIAGMVAGVLFGVASLLLAVVVYLQK